MGFVQKYWTPNIGCNIRISLATGIPEYDEYVKSISWFNRSGLRHSVPDGSVAYYGSQTRQYPKAIWPQMIKLKPDSVPLYPGHEEVSAYFPFGETARISSKDSLRFCIMSEPMRRLIRGRGSCRGISAGSLSSSTAALEVFQLRSWMRSPLGSTKSSNLVARPIAGLSGTAKLCRVLFGTLRVSSWANIWKHRWNSWTSPRRLSLSAGSHVSFSPF